METEKNINEFHVNAWLEQRGKLPRHRTISKARRAALVRATGPNTPLAPRPTTRVYIYKLPLSLTAGELL